MVATSVYSIVSTEFPVNRDIYVSYCQNAVGLGLLMGPVIGTSIYSFAGYERTFYMLAGILVMSMITAIIMISRRVNKFSSAESIEVIIDKEL